MTKLSVWAKRQGITYRTAWGWYKNNKLPVEVQVTKTGSIFVVDEPTIKKNKGVVIYGRVSSSNKKVDLDNQIKLCEQFCIAKGWEIKKTFKEIASGMNDNRKFLNAILENPPEILVVLHKDRLTRFGFNYIKTLLGKLNCTIVVINNNDTDNEDILKDFIAIITSFCCRLYGMRRGQSKALKLKEELKND
jgi:predicted site-specific integrase-resolvase